MKAIKIFNKKSGENEKKYWKSQGNLSEEKKWEPCSLTNR